MNTNFFNLVLSFLFLCAFAACFTADSEESSLLCKTEFNLSDLRLESILFENGIGLNLDYNTFLSDEGIASMSVFQKGKPNTVFHFDIKNFKILRKLNLDSIAAEINLHSDLQYGRFLEDGNLLIQTKDTICVIEGQKVLYVRTVLGSDEKIHDYYPIVLNYFPPHFNSKEGILRYGVYAYYKDSTLQSEYAFPAMEGVVLIDSDSINFVPRYRSKINVTGQYGLLDEYYRITVSDSTYYTYQSDPNIHVYSNNDLTQISRIVGGKSIYDKIPDILLSEEDRDNSSAKFQQFLGVGTYGRLRYNFGTEEFYRIFYQQTPITRPDGLHNTFSDQNRYLQVFSKDFCLLNEIPLELGVDSEIVLPRGEGYSVFQYRTDSTLFDTYKYFIKA